MESWQILLAVLGVAIVLAVSITLDRARSRRIGPPRGRGWDRFDPVQKLAVAFVAVATIVVVISRCVA